MRVMQECGVSIAQLGQYHSAPSRTVLNARTPWLIVLLDLFATGTFVGIPGRPFGKLPKIVCFHLSSQSRIIPQQLTSAWIELTTHSHSDLVNLSLRRGIAESTFVYLGWPVSLASKPQRTLNPQVLQDVVFLSRLWGVSIARCVNSLESA